MANLKYTSSLNFLGQLGESNGLCQVIIQQKRSNFYFMKVCGLLQPQLKRVLLLQKSHIELYRSGIICSKPYFLENFSGGPNEKLYQINKRMPIPTGVFKIALTPMCRYSEKKKKDYQYQGIIKYFNKVFSRGCFKCFQLRISHKKFYEDAIIRNITVDNMRLITRHFGMPNSAQTILIFSTLG